MKDRLVIHRKVNDLLEGRIPRRYLSKVSSKDDYFDSIECLKIMLVYFKVAILRYEVIRKRKNVAAKIFNAMGLTLGINISKNEDRRAH